VVVNIRVVKEEAVPNRIVGAVSSLTALGVHTHSEVWQDRIRFPHRVTHPEPDWVTRRGAGDFY
jgi:hypothetical protein